jgi:moderate conductance mechanosensitive channel
MWTTPQDLVKIPNPQGLLSVSERLYAWLVTDALNLLKVALAAWLLVKVLRWSTAKLLDWQQRGRFNIHREQMLHTVVSVMNDVGTVTIIGIAGMMALKDVNLDVRPLLAGAGVIGLAVGFGAQSLVKDLFHGIFIVLEDQYGIGDVIRTGAVTGQVERMTLRRTLVRDGEGTLFTIPNGEIQVLGNLTRDWSQVSFTIAVGNRQKLEEILELLRGTIADLTANPEIHPDLLLPPQLLGLERFTGGQMEILLQARTKPGRQADVGREWRRLIKLTFERAAIPLTDPQDLRVIEHAAPGSPGGQPGEAPR